MLGCSGIDEDNEENEENEDNEENGALSIAAADAQKKIVWV